jgi:glycosyltransferase involved in cell wall biosynthesis
MTVQLIFDRFGHHAGHAGYDQIFRYLTGRMPVEQLQPFPKSRAAAWIWERMTNHSGMGWYDQFGTSVETTAALRILKGKGEIYHYLNGENSYCYLGYVRRVMGRRRGALVGSYHQPPALFEKAVTKTGMLKDLDAIVAVSNNQVPYFSSLAGSGTKVIMIPHGMDTEYYCPAVRRPSDSITCLCVGQWLRDFPMLKAVAELVGPRDARIRFRVIGCGKAGEILQGVSNITVAGRLTDEELLDAYQQADIMVLPVSDSTANNALLEALSCGLPIVTTDVGGTRDYVNADCAFLAPLGDMEGMAQSVLQLAADARLRTAMGARSRELALTFSWEKVIGQLISLYAELAA